MMKAVNIEQTKDVRGGGVGVLITGLVVFGGVLGGIFGGNKS
ncbi:hypothetical protein [Vibrio crassostreae]|nr:hypothetical protein [Vibrio crassostreae]CAK3511669.1 hypothetical protein VCRA2121O334_40293 [Vibrio crassostreae]CAK3517759.1 hypothetical protein VCRA2122O341_30025 [Vibrio crassostreae]CAK3913867.1 hypothetical protein VCRA2120O333_40066 [Vibrio crassostreae]